MLALPRRGFQRSVNQHNIELAVCCDWLEATALFTDEGSVTGAEVVDVLRENEIYATQEFAWELVNGAFANIQERRRLLGAGYPLHLANRTRLERSQGWERYPGYTFCLTLSLAYAYPEWARAFGPDFTVQGELFERFTAESVQASFAGWSVRATGWTRTNTRGLRAIVDEVATLLGEATGDLLRWTKRSAKEAGLDLLCFRAFPDGRVGVPVFLVQCASGLDWKAKLRTPDLRIWTKIITFASNPKKAFATPFALQDSDFIQSCNVVNGLLLYRFRLLAPGRALHDWLSEDLTSRLTEWVRPRILSLPVSERAAEQLA